MIYFIVMPMSIARTNVTRVIIHDICLVTSTTKESSFGVEAIKNCFGNLLRKPWRIINVPKFFEVETTFWSRTPSIITSLIFVSNGLVILFLGVIISVMIFWHVTEWPNIFASSFDFFNFVFPDLEA